MVKRKAEISLEEWLDMAAAPSEAKNTNITAAKSDEELKPSPTAEQGLPEVKDGPVTSIPADVSLAESESSEWFWVLLEQVGYERW